MLICTDLEPDLGDPDKAVNALISIQKKLADPTSSAVRTTETHGVQNSIAAEPAEAEIEERDPADMLVLPTHNFKSSNTDDSISCVSLLALAFVVIYFLI